MLMEFVTPGAKVVSSSSYDSNVETVAFKNPDGTIVCVMLNRTDFQMPCIVRLDGHIKQIDMEPHSIVTVVIS